MKRMLSLAALLCAAAAAQATPVTYQLDPGHTYPSFEAPHIAGISMWRGKIDKNSGTVVLDREAKTGTVDVVMDMTTIDFGHEKMNAHAKSPDIFDTAKYPTAEFKADKIVFSGDTPSEIPGQLTLHGVTKPLTLKINSFKCITHPMLKKEVCGADAATEFSRSDYGVDYGVQNMGSPMVKLAIQVEGLRQDAAK